MNGAISAVGVTKTFRLPRVQLAVAPRLVAAVKDVSLVVEPGEFVGVVGESGSGKTTLARMLVGLLRPDSGSVSVGGLPVLGGDSGSRLTVRRSVQMVFQDPHSSLDPRMRVGRAIVDPMSALDVPGDHQARTRELLDLVQLPGGASSKFPHEFSGGQLQRVAIARALAPNPKVLIADEPVSALDLSVQAQILNLLLDLRAEFGLTVVLIAHDLGVVRHLVDRVVVMAEGRVVETGPTEAVFNDPRHPYTERLLSSIIGLDGTLNPLQWSRRSLHVAPACPFADRCPYAFESCIDTIPELSSIANKGLTKAACHLRDLPQKTGSKPTVASSFPAPDARFPDS